MRFIEFRSILRVTLSLALMMALAAVPAAFAAGTIGVQVNGQAVATKVDPIIIGGTTMAAAVDLPHGSGLTFSGTSRVRQ